MCGLFLQLDLNPQASPIIQRKEEMRDYANVKVGRPYHIITLHPELTVVFMFSPVAIWTKEIAAVYGGFYLCLVLASKLWISICCVLCSLLIFE